MSPNKSASEILDRYMLAVRRALPVKEREDIAREIRSHILDALEEKHPDEKEWTKEQLIFVLEEMGAPRKIASQFGPQRSLISARLFPTYLMVLKIVCIAVAGALALSFIISAIVGNENITWKFGLEILGSMWNGALTAGAFVTLIFAVIDFAAGEKDLKDLEELKELEVFKLDDLPEISEGEKDPSVLGTILEIVFGVLGLAFLTWIYNQNGSVPFISNPNNPSQAIEIFTQNFLRFVPVMLAVGGFEVARSSLLLVQGKHTSVSNWWLVCIKAANIIYTILMLRAFPLISLTGVQSLPNAPELGYAGISNGVNLGIRIIMGISIIGNLVEAIKTLYREVTKPAGA